jgi:hypothetical protein
MPILTHSELLIDADAVLRGQGADPAAIRQRRPLLVRVAEEAIAEGYPLLKPEVAYSRIPVEAVTPEQITLAGGGLLTGKIVARRLRKATEVIVAVCTVGEEIAVHASEVIRDDLVRGLALDGVGSAAVEALSNWACAHFEAEAGTQGMQTTVPLNPGMIGWPLEVGQPQIFNVLHEPQMRVTLSDAIIMLPRKSLSLVIGLGAAVRSVGTVCDTCAMNKRCRYKPPEALKRPDTAAKKAVENALP